MIASIQPVARCDLRRARVLCMSHQSGNATAIFKALNGDVREAVMVVQDYLFMLLLFIVCASTMLLWDEHHWRHHH
jgi:hypothetical protein